MSIALAERLKHQWTGRSVAVIDGVPELTRFSQWVGLVKTVNMNGRCLVQFVGQPDEGWYDIDPSFLTILSDAELAIRTKPVEKTTPPAPPKPAASPVQTGGKSPLELARLQAKIPAVATSVESTAPVQSAPANQPAGKPSPLDLIRQQGAARSKPAAASALIEPSVTDSVATDSVATPASANPDASVQPAAELTAPPDAPPPRKFKPLDDLKIVEGIGPRIEKLLLAEGIKTFEQLAQTEVARIVEILRSGGPRFSMHDPDSWPAQARLAADEKWEELKVLQKELNAGRYQDPDQ